MSKNQSSKGRVIARVLLALFLLTPYFVMVLGALAFWWPLAVPLVLLGLGFAWTVHDEYR